MISRYNILHSLQTADSDTGEEPVFLGKTIKHEWIEEDRSNWFIGKVLSLLRGTDGMPNSVYEVFKG